MNTRNITLTLEKAKEWYNSGSADLKEVALQAFSKKELSDFRSLTGVAEVMSLLGLDFTKFYYEYFRLYKISRASAASFTLNLIRKALNQGYNMEFTKGDIYYPIIHIVPEGNTYYDSELENGDLCKVAELKIKGSKYFLVGGGASNGSGAGLGYFSSYADTGFASSIIGFLGCATKEIAQHMSRYFAKEIFTAMYSDIVDIECLE